METRLPEELWRWIFRILTPSEPGLTQLRACGQVNKAWQRYIKPLPEPTSLWQRFRVAEVQHSIRELHELSLAHSPQMVDIVLTTPTVSVEDLSYISAIMSDFGSDRELQMAAVRLLAMISKGPTFKVPLNRGTPLLQRLLYSKLYSILGRHALMMMIAFITFKSSLVPLLKGL